MAHVAPEAPRDLGGPAGVGLGVGVGTLTWPWRAQDIDIQPVGRSQGAKGDLRSWIGLDWML